MFIQTIRGRTSNAEQVLEHGERWAAELGPDADGWLGTTSGVTDDDTFIAVVRFESREAAEANSRSDRQSAWWAEMEKLLDGGVSFHDSDDVLTVLQGGSDDAGFVQVMEGTVKDDGALRDLMRREEALHEMRPEIIGATIALDGTGGFVETVAFSDEASARSGEQSGQAPDDVRAQMEAAIAEVTFYDLLRPVFHSRT
jgi:hypothetical protein